jgi:CheY-like chemotaxis protein
MARVLIAEPSADVRALLERSVRRLGHEPSAHDCSGDGALDVDVLLLEPAFNGGIELARTMRARQPRLAIVICSIFPPSHDLQDLGPVAHVLKPFQRDALEDALTAAVKATDRAHSRRG